MTLLELTSNQATGPLRCNKEYVQVFAWHYLLVVNIEAMGEKNARTFIDAREYTLVQVRLHEVGCKEGTYGGTAHSVLRFFNRQAIRLGALPAGSAFAQADHNIVAAVSEVQRVGASLATISQYGQALSIQK
jgi:hypothetical protein